MKFEEITEELMENNSIIDILNNLEIENVGFVDEIIGMPEDEREAFFDACGEDGWLVRVSELLLFSLCMDNEGEIDEEAQKGCFEYIAQVMDPIIEALQLQVSRADIASLAIDKVRNQGRDGLVDDIRIFHDHLSKPALMNILCHMVNTSAADGFTENEENFMKLLFLYWFDFLTYEEAWS